MQKLCQFELPNSSLTNQTVSHAKQLAESVTSCNYVKLIKSSTYVFSSTYKCTADSDFQGERVRTINLA